MTHARKRLLVVGEAQIATGFARVIESICRRVSGSLEVHHLAVGYWGDPHDLPWHLYPAAADGNRLGTNRLCPIVALVKPHALFMMNDIWVLADYWEALSTLPGRPPTIMYCPIDAGPIESTVLRRLEGVDRFFVYTEYAANQVKAALTIIRRDTPTFQFPAVEVMPHGTDRCFGPIGERRLANGISTGREDVKRNLFGDDDDLVRSFIVLNANRNQPRKRIDITMRAFAEFACDKPPNVKLYLHMGLEDLGWPIVRLGERLGIHDRLIATHERKQMPHLTHERLNLIYNACDVGVNTAVGEGWGLVSFEHGATGAPQLVPNHTACAELWRDHGLLIDPVAVLTNEQTLRDEHIVDERQLAGALESVYTQPGLFDSLSERAKENSSRYDSDEIASRWCGVFESLIGNRHSS